MVPKPGKGQIKSANSAFNSVFTTNVGIFQINEELDNALVYTSLETSKNLLSYKDNQITSIAFTLHADAEEETATKAIQLVLGDLYKMLNTENLAVYLIFTLVLIIALFNVIGSIVMMILDKKKNLNTLFNLGVSIKELRRIFFVQGSLMSVVGGIIGLVLGFLIVLAQKLFSLAMITASLPYPVSIKPMNLVRYTNQAN